MTLRCSPITAFALMVASMTTSLTSADSPVEGKLNAFLGAPELSIQPVFQGGRFPNVVVTGHQAYFTREAMERIAECTMDNATSFKKEGLCKYAVETSPLDSSPE